MKFKRLAQLLPPPVGLLPLAAVLLVWQCVAPDESPSFPPPSNWWTAIRGLTADGLLGPAVLATLQNFAAGLLAACALGFTLGLLIGVLPGLRRWTGMLLEYLRALPPPVVVPIAILMLGFSPGMQIGVIAYTTAWPILLNTVAGVAAIRELQLDVGRSMRMPWTVRMIKIVIPATLPAFLLGVRVAVSLAIVVTLLVEMFTGLPGIGLLMVTGQRNFNSSQVFGLLAVVGLLAFCLTLAFNLIEGLVLSRWPPRRSAGA
ncbi:MAG: binding-protein-dependent transport system inner rane component [Betaproteobacteria bacterium]|nr:binding-protein-dependent transport system inner rane component [Betaproteobacteria bacterium]